MKSLKTIDLLPYALSLILAGSGIYFRENEEYAKLLLIVGAIIAISPTLIKFTFKYIIDRIISYVSSKGMRINYSGESGKEYAEETYKIAAKKGGTIIATHIFQNRVKPEDDMAYKILNKSINHPINFKRALIFNNKREELEWLETFYEIDNENLKFSAFIWNNIDFLYNKSLLGLIPRINFLLYKGLNDEEYRILIGFEKVRSRSNFLTRRLNFSITFTNKLVYKALNNYFQSITAHPEVIEIGDLPSYKEYSLDFVHSPDEQFIIKELLDFAYTNENVMHVGAFGKTAILLQNLSKIRKRANHLSDIDLLFIVKKDIVDFKTTLNEKITNLNINVELVFGDDKDYFYDFRTKGKTVIDIEVFEFESNFYKTNRLLGYSIFHYYFNLFTISNFTLDELIHMPIKPIRFDERKKLFLENRKSISEFIEKLKSNESNTIDLRRVLTINIKNLNWVLTGFRSSDVETSIEYLLQSKIINNDDYIFITKTLDSNRSEIEKGYITIKNLVLANLISFKASLE